MSQDYCKARMRWRRTPRFRRSWDSIAFGRASAEPELWSQLALHQLLRRAEPGPAIETHCAGARMHDDPRNRSLIRDRAQQPDKLRPQTIAAVRRGHEDALHICGLTLHIPEIRHTVEDDHPRHPDQLTSILRDGTHDVGPLQPIVEREAQLLAFVSGGRPAGPLDLQVEKSDEVQFRSKPHDNPIDHCPSLSDRQLVLDLVGVPEETVGPGCIRRRSRFRGEQGAPGGGRPSYARDAVMDAVTPEKDSLRRECSGADTTHSSTSPRAPPIPASVRCCARWRSG